MKREQHSWALFRVLPLLTVGSADKSCLTSLNSLSNAIWVYFSEVSKNSCSHSLCQCPCARSHCNKSCLWECVTPAQDKAPGAACDLGKWAEQSLEIPRREVMAAVQFLRKGRADERLLKFAEGLRYTRVSWEEKIPFFHSSQASSSSTSMVENGFPWGDAGRAAGVTASHNSAPSAKILGAEAVFFALPVLCFRLWEP